MKRFLLYVKYYHQPKHKDVSARAMQSARDFWKTETKIPKNADTFQAYQRGYIHAYRHSYAKAMLDSK